MASVGNIFRQRDTPANSFDRRFSLEPEKKKNTSAEDQGIGEEVPQQALLRRPFVETSSTRFENSMVAAGLVALIS